MKQKAAHQNVLYTVQQWVSFSREDERVFSPNDPFFFRHEDAVAKAKCLAEKEMIAVILRHTIDFGGEYKLRVLQAALEGKARQFIVGTERLEAWGKTTSGKVKRVNLRGARWRKWDGCIR